ncbi:hypothetical protein HPB47_015568, partial [Ixodes persulcatus]
MPSTKTKTTQRWCFVPGCNGGYKLCGDKLPLFRAPKNPDALQKADKPLEENSAACERHFDDRCVHLCTLKTLKVVVKPLYARLLGKRAYEGPLSDQGP